ncbi:MAG: hypothetical protein CMH79_05895 [Nitrospinae bacterium]|nr:hypothetical protein [Nitrospinota bacterium]
METKVMLAREYVEGMVIPSSENCSQPPVGWVCEEKYDGYRCIYLAKKRILVSRANKIYEGTPEWFKLAMPPNEDLDGELWAGRGNFQSMGVVRRKPLKGITRDKEWIPIKYVVYDLPNRNISFKERKIELKKIIDKNNLRWSIVRETLPPPFNTIDCPIIYSQQTVIQSTEHLNKMYQDIIKNGGEGLMLKEPKSLYEDKRSYNMLKLKPSFDEEGIIVDYKMGKNKYTGLLGGFVCKPLINMNHYHIIDNKESHEFTISGMDDTVRKDYKVSHPIGSVISYTHNGKTNLGKPRFARYIRKRDDIIIKDNDVSITNKNKNNKEIVCSIINIFKELYEYEKINNEIYKANTYLKAISGLKKINHDIELTEENIKNINGIGKSTYDKINEIITTGSCNLYEKIKNIQDPRKLFINIHGIGPKKANELVKMGHKTIQDLKNITDENTLTTSQRIGIKYYEDIKQEIPRGEIKKHEELLKYTLNKIDKNAELTIAGSYRRNKETSGDIDVLLKAEDNSTYDRFIKRLKYIVYLIEDIAYGRKKYNGISRIGRNGIGRRIDIMYTKPSEYPFAILYFTGSDDFNKMMRKSILEKGMTINEYSLKDGETKQPINHVFREEKDIFNYLKIEYIEPWQRL